MQCDLGTRNSLLPSWVDGLRKEKADLPLFAYGAAIVRFHGIG